MKTVKLYGIKALSLVLSLLMVLSVLPVSVIGVNAQTPGGSTTYTVIACGDFQYPNSGSSLADPYASKVAELNGGTACYNHQASKLIIENILETMTDTKNITAVDAAIQTGDFHYNYPVSDNYAGIDYYKEAISGVLKDGGQTIIVHGNHDVDSDSSFSSTGANDPANGAYGVYVINEDDFPWDADNESLVKTTTEGLRRYLNNKLAVGYTAPIFIVTHVPLYFTVRTVQQIGGKYAGYIFDVLNDAAEHGLNIVMMSGHNHSQSFDDYMGGAEICYQPGDDFNVARVVNGSITCSTEEIKFTYLNSGYVGYYENYNSNFSSAEQDNYDLTMTSYQFNDTTLEINRYSFLKETTTTLKAAGKTSSKFASQELTYTEPQTNTIASGLTIDLTGEVDTDYEIPAVVHTEEASSSSASSSSASSYTYERITSVDDITDDDHYLLLLTDSAYSVGTNAFLDNTYATSNLTGYEYIGPVLVSSGISTLTDEISGAYTGYEWGIAKSGTTYTLTATTDEYAGKELKATSRSGKSVDSGNYDLTFEDSGSAFKIAAYDTGTFSIQDNASGYYFRKSSRADLIYGYGSLNTHIAIYRRTSVPVTECDTWYEAGTQDVTTTSTVTPTLYYTVPSGQYSLLGGSGFLESSGTALSGNSTSQTEAHEKWTFTKLSNDSTDHTYTITDENGKYLNISSSAVSLSSTSQTLTLTGNADGSFTISDGSGHYLYKSGNSVSSSSTGTAFTAYTWTSEGGTTTTTENETRYVLTSSVTAGNNYVIANTNSATTSGHTITNNSGSVADTTATIYAADSASGVYIKNPASGAIWTASANSSYFRFKNGSYYIAYNKNFKLDTGTGGNRADWTISNSATTMQSKASTSNYMRYSNGWGVSKSNSNKVYFYKETTIAVQKTVDTTVYTYNQQNTNPTSYQGEAVEVSTTNTYTKYAMLASHDTFSIPLDSDSDAVAAIIRNVTTGIKVSTYLSNDSTDITAVAATDSKITLDTSNLNTSVAGTYNVNVKYNNIIIGTVDVTVPAQAPIASVALSQNYGSVYLNTGSTAKTGAYLIITRTDGTVSNVPVTTGMLIDYSGNCNAKQYTKALGTYEGLGVFYNNGDGYWFDDFTLKVIEPDDYPEYPDEGSVKVGKSGEGIDFQNTGVAQVELTATGVPKNPGIDLVIVMDTSSSMNNSENGYYNGQAVFGTQASGWFYEDGTAVGSDFSSSAVTDKKTRLEIAEESLSNLLVNLNKVGEDGMSRDIDVAICTFNGMTYIDGDDNANYFTDADTWNNEESTAAVLTGDKTYTENGFQNITELQNYDTSIIDDYFHSGTNYDKAFQSAYELAAAKQAANKLAGEDRDLYIIFMSDGCPFQYNYFGSNYGSTEWNNWIAGTYADTSSFPLNSTSQSYFYNGLNNKHRMAEALKGETDTLYTIIDPTCTAGEVDVTGDGVNDPYMKQIYGLGAKMYSIAFCIAPDNKITVDAMNTCIENVATSEEYFYKANSPEALDTAFSLINTDIKEAATEAYFIDTMGPAYDIRLAKDYEVGGVATSLDYSPKIVATNYTVYTRADYLKGTINDIDQIGTRVSGGADILETVTFNADGTEAYSDQIDGGATNIMTDGIIRAKNFIYNNTSAPIKIDSDGDGVNDLSLPAESFFWKIGIITDTEFSLSYYVYLTGSMEGERAAGSYETNESAVLYYKNYLGNDCHKDTVSPVLPWEAATVNYEFYLVNADGQPVNSAGTVVPFENRVKIGRTQTKTILLNSDSSDTSYKLYAGAEIPEGYTLFNPDAAYEIHVGSGELTSSAAITDIIPATTYYYETGYKFKGNGEVTNITDYGNTHIAFAVLLKASVINDTVIIDYGLPVRIHLLANDLGLLAATEVNSISVTVPSALNTPLTKSEFTAATALSLENGDVALSEDGKTAVYTPKNATMGDEEVFYYEIVLDGNYYYGKCTVIPATKIYYEEDFFTFTDGSSGCKWSVAGEEYENVFQAEDRPGTFSLGSYDANNNYGRDTAYDASTATYSLGSAMSATVDASTLGKEPKAEFTFCGTGFELFSVTTNKSGTLLVKVQSLTEGITYNKTYIVNTYYGYAYGRLYIDGKDGTNTKTTLSPTYTVNDETFNNVPLYETPYEPGVVHPEEGEIIITVNGKVYSNIDHSTDSVTYDYAYGWLLESGEDVEERGLYQVPVVTIPDDNGSGINIAELTYGTYKVTVTPKYSKTFDKTGCGEYTVVIDGIRVINPAGKGDDISEVVSAAYEQDAESNPQYTEVRDDVIADTDNFLKTVATDENSTVGGAIFLDGITALGSGIEEALNKYKETGPNNEMYLYDGQAIAFKPEITSCLAAPASFQLGMKVTADGETYGAEAAIKVIISDDEDNKIRGIHTISVKGSAEQFYNLSSYLSWEKDDAVENRYVSKYTVVILNDSDAVVSLTSFKWTFRNSDVPVETEAPSVSLASTRATLDFAEEVLMSVYDTVDTSDVKLSWVTDTLETGALARLEITTNQEISSITIDNTEITVYNDLNNGERQWVYEFTVTENSDSTYDVVLKDSRGRVSETLTTDALTVEKQEDAGIVINTETESGETTEEGEITENGETTEDGETTEMGAFAKLKAVLKRILELIKKVIGW